MKNTEIVEAELTPGCNLLINAPRKALVLPPRATIFSSGRLEAELSPGRGKMAYHI